MGGISETGRYYVAYVYAVEFMPNHFKDKTGLYIFVCFGVCMIAICLRFWVIADRIWTWNAYLAIAMAIISFVLTIVWLPESPSFLYSRKRFSEAELVLQQIYKVNNNGQEVKFEFMDAR
jgi:MFS family permease